MSTTVIKKRKSTSDAAAPTKKVKVAKSAEKPAPLKSALKKPGEQKVVETVTKMTKTTKEQGKKHQENAAEKLIIETTATEADDEIDGGAETADQTAGLLAGFSSSEDEASGAEDGGIATERLPQAPRVKEVQKAIKNARDGDPERTPGVIYVGRIPHGFYEHQMKAYFSQFGDITHLRLARNRKTGKSQHYAFVEFASKAVAEIVAKTMDKYLLFNHILQVRTVPPEQISEHMWNGTGRRKKPAPRNRIEGGKLKRGMVKEDWDKRIEAERLRREEKAEKLKELGYGFEMPVLKSAREAKSSTTLVEGGDADAGAQEDSARSTESAGNDAKTEVKVPTTVQEELAGLTVAGMEREKKPGNKRAAPEVKTTVKKVKKAKK